MAEVRKVVITGAGLATPAGYTVAENVAAWRAGKACFREITLFKWLNTEVRHAGECPNPDVKKLPDRKVQKILRRKDVISLLTILDTAKHAGVVRGTLNPERVGMYVGASSMQVFDGDAYAPLIEMTVDKNSWKLDSALFGDKLEVVNPLVLLQTLMNNSLCFGTMTLDFRGVNANFMDFQVAGLKAVGEAFRSISTGRADAVLAGGLSTPVEPSQVSEWVHLGHLARTIDLESAATVVRPFNKGRSGTILSEGSAYLFLEEEQHAIRRGARILGRVHGFGMSSDGAINFNNQHKAPGLVRSLRLACGEAKQKASDLGLIVGHANGSRFGDDAEADAYVDFLAGSQVPVTSPKGLIGDLCEAGGVIGAILALDAFEQGSVPGTGNFAVGEGASAKLALSAKEQPLSRKVAAVTARNFLGLSAALVVGEP